MNYLIVDHLEAGFDQWIRIYLRGEISDTRWLTT